MKRIVSLICIITMFVSTLWVLPIEVFAKEDKGSVIVNIPKEGNIMYNSIREIISIAMLVVIGEIVPSYNDIDITSENLDWENVDTYNYNGHEYRINERWSYDGIVYYIEQNFMDNKDGKHLVEMFDSPLSSSIVNELFNYRVCDDVTSADNISYTFSHETFDELVNQNDVELLVDQEIFDYYVDILLEEINKIDVRFVPGTETSSSEHYTMNLKSDSQILDLSIMDVLILFGYIDNQQLTGSLETGIRNKNNKEVLKIEFPVDHEITSMLLGTYDYQDKNLEDIILEKLSWNVPSGLTANDDIIHTFTEDDMRYIYSVIGGNPDDFNPSDYEPITGVFKFSDTEYEPTDTRFVIDCRSYDNFVNSLDNSEDIEIFLALGLLSLNNKDLQVDLSATFTNNQGKKLLYAQTSLPDFSKLRSGGDFEEEALLGIVANILTSPIYIYEDVTDEDLATLTISAEFFEGFQIPVQFESASIHFDTEGRINPDNNTMNLVNPLTGRYSLYFFIVTISLLGFVTLYIKRKKNI